jgi:3-deoxy-D-manno-octulosonic acid kinase
MLDVVVATHRSPGVKICYPAVEASDFDPLVFDETKLASRQLIEGSAVAGRGNTCFFRWANRQLVLRQYRRGGLVRHISKNQYVYTGLERTRPIRELDVLLKLQQLQLPAPKPYACKVVRHCLTYSASLITYRLPGFTLAEKLNNESDDDIPWDQVGRVIGEFHRAGVYHADLNAQNILIDEDDSVSLIDFDRAEIRSSQSAANIRRWGLQNLNRLQRSLVKNANAKNADTFSAGNTCEQQMIRLKQQWTEALTGR